MSLNTIGFFGLVFMAVVLLLWGLFIPAFGDGARVRRALKRRLSEIDSGMQAEIASLLRAKYLRDLSPFERRLEQIPAMESLARVIEQAGLSILAYRLVLLAGLLAVVGSVALWIPTRMPAAALAGAVLGAIAPFFKVFQDRKRRFDKLEEQMADAIDMLKRALRAGHPFGASVKLVSEDMPEPIAKEFETTFADINYGNDLRRAMLGLLSRVPSISVMALTTAVLVQKESGGNLAEILEQISKVIRGRFRFYRRVRTLSAEGRMSAWVLALVPLFLFGVMTITTPTYLPVLLDHETGRKMVLFALFMGAIGVLWIRRILRIEV
jgi:tight adherence protein B